MSKLIDNVINEEINKNKILVNDKWYIAKPLDIINGCTLIKRIKDCIRIIEGKSIAVHYKQDEIYGQK